jgi:cytochrome c-type biogenesis protein CcmH
MKRLIILLFGSLVLSFSAVAAIDVFEFDNEQQEEQFKELSQTLRCPKCQNNTISDSNAELAKDLRVKVYEMTKEGKSKSEIVDYMIARYGNFVTYKPPFTIATSILWLGPLFVVLLGFSVLVFNSKRKSKQASQSSDWDAENEARLKNLLKDEDEDGDKQ